MVEPSVWKYERVKWDKVSPSYREVNIEIWQGEQKHLYKLYHIMKTGCKCQVQSEIRTDYSTKPGQHTLHSSRRIAQIVFSPDMLGGGYCRCKIMDVNPSAFWAHNFWYLTSVLLIMFFSWKSIQVIPHRIMRFDVIARYLSCQGGFMIFSNCRRSMWTAACGRAARRLVFASVSRCQVPGFPWKKGLKCFEIYNN